MTGVAFILYTFYMVTDPATTPTGFKGQIAFGASVGAAYGVLLVAHVVFGLFFALTLVSALRAGALYARNLAAQRTLAKGAAQPAPQVMAVAKEV
jgi:enediyne biosynthesis protein E5